MAKNILYFFLGLLVTSSMVRVLYVVQGVAIGYFSGVNPYALLFHIPLIASIEAFVGLTLLGVLRIFGKRLVNSGSIYMMYGMILGLSGAGSLIMPWINNQYVELLVFATVVASALFVALKKSSGTRVP